MHFSYALTLRCFLQKCIISLVGWCLVMAIVSLLSMLIVAKKLIDPITELTAATKKVGRRTDLRDA